MRKGLLVMVEWEDASCHTSWYERDETSSLRGINTVSIGWKVKTKKGYIGVAASRNEHEKYTDINVIPRKNIISIRKLE